MQLSWHNFHRMLYVLVHHALKLKKKNIFLSKQSMCLHNSWVDLAVFSLLDNVYE